MSGRTWLLMCVILGLNWGGFILALAYGIRREKRKQHRDSGGTRL